MGKIFVLSVTDHEEYILSRIMEIIAAEPGFDHIVSFHPCNTLVFPGLELRLKERTVHRNGELISMTHREFATLVYLANHPSWVFSAGQIYEEVWGEDGENCGTAVASVIGLEMSRNVQSGNTQNLKSMVIQRSFPKWSVAERRKTAAASDQAAVCACAHSRYFAGGSPSGLRV